MEEKKVPWWRKALSFALDGLRSGFGLFSKSAKESPVDEPEIVSVQKGTPEETELIEQRLSIESVAETVRDAEFVPVSEMAIAPEPEAQAETAIEAFAVREAATERAADSGADTHDPPAEAKIEAEAIGVDEPLAGAVPEVPAEESAVLAESVGEPLQETGAAAEAVAEHEADVEHADEEEVIPEPVAVAVELAAEKGLDLREEPDEHTSGAEAVVGFADLTTGLKSRPTVRPSSSDTGEGVALPKPEAIAPGDEAAEAEAAAAIESAPEAVIIEEPVSGEGSVPETAISSVELIEPVTEEVTPQTIGQPVAVEEESYEEVAPVPEAASQTEDATGSAAEQAVNEVVEEAPEAVIEHMDLKEPIPEQATEPTEASEAVAAGEEVAGEAVANEAAPETAIESTVAAEEVASEQAEPEVAAAQTEAVTLSAVAAPTALPSIGAAPEPASEAASAPEPAPPLPPHKPFIKLESRDNEADLSPFSVIVSQVYDGPLDLLLDLIRKQDIDIYDIPIARITAQFLAYVNQLKATDVDVAGEFIYTASLLIHIKSKMLLPRAPSGQDDAAEDPRRELVERLLEHERFKNAAQMLQQKQMLEAASWTNPGLREFQDDTSAEPEIAADTVDLVRIFRDILERARNRPVIDVEEDSVTVGQMIQFLSRRLTMEDKPVALRRLLSHTRSERALIAMFLALLELVRLQAILLRQDLAFSEIFIKKHTGFEAVMNEGAASARDDWR